MSIHTQVAKLVAARNLVNKGLAPILEQLKDTSIALEDRWAAYVSLVENDVLTDNDSYGDGFINTLDTNATLYDDFDVERHETMLYIDMHERIMESEEGNEWEETLFAMRENLPAWQEKVLEGGAASFTHDW